jgi:hypothetical protein
MIEIFKVGFDNKEELTKWLEGKPCDFKIRYNDVVNEYFGKEILNVSSDKLTDIMQYLAEESVVNLRKLGYLKRLNERISEEI